MMLEKPSLRKRTLKVLQLTRNTELARAVEEMMSQKEFTF